MFEKHKSNSESEAALGRAFDTLWDQNHEALMRLASALMDPTHADKKNLEEDYAAVRKALAESGHRNASDEQIAAMIAERM